ncbi:MAG: hypothetical protein ACKOX3_01545 [Bacteroidota bacterium]
MMKDINYILKVWMATIITTPILISAITMVDLWVNKKTIDAGIIEFTILFIGLGALISLPSYILLALFFNVTQKKLNKVQLKLMMIVLGSLCIIFESIYFFGLNRTNYIDIFQLIIFYVVVMMFYAITCKINSNAAVNSVENKSTIQQQDS